MGQQPEVWETTFSEGKKKSASQKADEEHWPWGKNPRGTNGDNEGHVVGEIGTTDR